MLGKQCISHVHFLYLVTQIFCFLMSLENAPSELIVLPAVSTALLTHSCKVSPWRPSSTLGVTFAKTTVLDFQDKNMVQCSQYNSIMWVKAEHLGQTRELWHKRQSQMGHWPYLCPMLLALFPRSGPDSASLPLTSLWVGIYSKHIYFSFGIRKTVIMSLNYQECIQGNPGMEFRLQSVTNNKIRVLYR